MPQPLDVRLRHLRQGIEQLSASLAELQHGCAQLRAAPVRAAVSPLVSTVLITYNQERFVEEALRSVLSQRYAPLDIVILDDASTDATAAIIADELANWPEREDVRFIRNERNLGMFENGKKGILIADGDLIVVCSGDDVMLPTMVEEMVAVWRRENLSLVTANVSYIDEDSNELNRFWRDPADPIDDSVETLARESNNALCFGAAMAFERALYDEFGYPPAYLTAEDIMLPFYACLAKGARFIPKPLMKYRVHGENASLGLASERQTSPIAQVLHQAENYYIHLAHSVLMKVELERLSRADPARFAAIAGRLQPLIGDRIFEMSTALVDARRQLCELGITRPLASHPQAHAS